MSFWRIIKGLNFKQLRSLFAWFIRHPLLMMSTVQATLKTFKISQKEFPHIHGKHNKANAFRHALWNVLIAKACARFSNNTQLVLNWTKRITDWHEEFSPNEKLAAAMDFHNNKIGREMYPLLHSKSAEEITAAIKLELKEAVRVSSVSVLGRYPQQMVYLEH